MALVSRLVGTSAVVTGLSTGIGKAIAIALARAGANVAGVHLDEEDAGREVAAEIEAEGVEAAVFRADTGVPETAAAVADEAAGRWGGVDIWVNNAARLMVKPVVETSDEDWHGLLGANLHGYFYGCRAAARHMYGQGRGRIINVTSAADILHVADLAAYTTAKGGIVSLTKTLALEAARHGVTVNAVAPGAVDTPLNAGAYTPEVRATYENRIPAGRIGSPEDVAGVVAFLATEAAGYVTGHELVVDGGLVINGTVGHTVDA